MPNDDDAAFSTFGPLVDDADVPELVRAGVTVWSYGYGSDLEYGEFTTIDESDLWAWESEEYIDVVSSWAPFRKDEW